VKRKEVFIMTAKIAIFIILCSTATSTIYLDQGYQPVGPENEIIDSMVFVYTQPSTQSIKSMEAVPIQFVTADPATTDREMMKDRDEEREKLIVDAFNRVYGEINAKLENARLRGLSERSDIC